MVVRQRSPLYPLDTSPSPLCFSSSLSANSINFDEIEAVAMESENEIVPEVPWKNTFNMRPLTLAALSSSRPQSRSSQSALNRMKSRTITSAAKSLDILRQNLQAAINKEIDLVIKKYLETFFEPAIRNIRKNLGSNSVSEDIVKEVCRTILEEAKQMYCAGVSTVLQSAAPPPPTTILPNPDDFIFTPPDPVMLPSKKRKSSDLSPNSDLEITLKNQSSYDYNKWDPARITPETPFILSTTAGKCLGLGSLRGRLFVKHPELMRYNLDTEDREWMTSARIPGMAPYIPSTYLMLLEDIIDLALGEYCTSPNLALEDLRGFEVPDFMLRKIKAHLSILRAKHICSQPVVDTFEIPSIGFGVDCVSSTMTPPSILETDLIELPSPYFSFTTYDEED